MTDTLAQPPQIAPSDKLDSDWLRQICLEAGADDVGFVEIDRSAVADQKADILSTFAKTRTLVSMVFRMNRENVRTPQRSLSNIEFHHTGDHVLDTSRAIIRKLEDLGIRGVYPAMGFPMEMDHYPGKTWVVSHKPVAVEAGLGRIGIHRNIIHPKFGNFVLLDTLMIEKEMTHYDKPIDYNPCLECKLCVAACPVGAIGPDGHFDFAACYNHNYHEFMGGFTALTEKIADSKDSKDLRSKITDAESASWWQSLAFGPNYKAAYCLSVCPAGEDVIGPYLENKSQFRDEILKPLKEKEEPIYVVRGTDAEAHVKKRFKNKTVRHMKSHLRPTSIEGFLRSMPLVFNRHKAKDLDLTFHFRFSGAVKIDATVTIRDKTVTVIPSLEGKPNITIQADADSWLGFLRKDKSMPLLLISRKIKIKGPIAHMKSFARCFR